MRQLTVLLVALMALPVPAMALEAGEFHLYGIDKAGIAYDITPHGDRQTGDPEGKSGFRSQMVRWLKGQEAGKVKANRVCTGRQADECLRWELMQPMGRCTVKLKSEYRLSCDAGAMSGVLYIGSGLDAAHVSAMADVEALYKSFLLRHDNADPELAAVYRCQDGCKEGLPSLFIFLWLGD